MSRARYITLFFSMAVLLALPLTFSGCKAQQQMQQQLADADNRMLQLDRRIKDVESEQKKVNMQVNQLSVAVKNVSDLAIKLQQIEEERERAVQEAKQKAEAKGKPAKKAAAKPGLKKKKK